MAEGFEPNHVPQQSRRDKLRVVPQNQRSCDGNLQGYSGLVPIYDPPLVSSDLLTCANLHHQSHPVAGNRKQCSNLSTEGSGAKADGASFMGYVGGMIGVSSSSSATNHMYMDPQSSIHLNPCLIQDIGSNPYLYNPRGLRFLDQSFHGDDVVAHRPEPLSVAHESNNDSKCGQGLSLSLSSHHSQRSSLPLELNLKRYDSSIYSARVSVGSHAPGIDCGVDACTSNGLSRSSAPLGAFTVYASVLKGSRFLRPAQQLLEELCDIGRGTYDDKIAADVVLLDPPLESFAKTGIDDDPQSCSPVGEHRSKKSRLMSMLHEVYKRYKQYYQQMQSVVASFESLSGLRNAAPFTNLAFKAMSKHFRCLKKALTDQLQFMIESHGHLTGQKDNTALGFEKTAVGPNCHRPIQNVGFVENQPVWRPQRGLPERAVTVLRAWLFEHFLHPYPTDTDKLMLAKQTGLSRNQVSNWFINARVRLWKPMVEEIHMLETRQAQKSSPIEELNADGQNDVILLSNPISCEKTSGHEQIAQDFPSKRTRTDSQLPIESGDDTYIPCGNSARHPRMGAGAGGSGGVSLTSLTLGLHQNNEAGLRDPFPRSAARRLGLDANGEGNLVGGFDVTNRQFGREIIGTWRPTFG